MYPLAAPRWLIGLRAVAVLLVSHGCAATSEPSVSQATSLAASRPVVDTSAVRSLARLLPVGADRCSIAQPFALAREHRPLAALISQTERLPWHVQLDVLGYARVERARELAPRAVVELLRFAPAPRSQIMAELARAEGRSIVWDEEAPDAPDDGCAGELTCKAQHGRFLDDTTVALTHGAWGNEGDEPGSEQSCVRALQQHAQALEVSARDALVAGTELRDSTARLELRQDGLVRISERRYASVEAAARAEREALRGHEELASTAGVVASALGQREGDVIRTHSFVGFDDLRLAHTDQQRASALRQRPATALDRVDAADAEAVRAAFDAELPALARLPHDAAALGQALDLLTRARALHPDDDGLARRAYALVMRTLGDAAGALAVANDALARGVGDAADWQRKRRAALVQLDEAALRLALQQAFQLSREVATRLAAELRDKTRAGADYERAEWAFLTARRLASHARAERRVSSAVVLRVDELVRVFALLAQSARPHEDLAVHVLAPGAATLATRPDEGALWLEETHGGDRAGLLLAAPSWDDVQLRLLERALARRLPEGPFELVLGLEAVGSARQVTLALAGQRRGDTLHLESVSRRVASLRWRLLDRLLLTPLHGMVGATYPPDELVVQALDAREARAVVEAAEGVSSITCEVDGLSIRCRGALSDQSAARRALLAVLHAQLARDAETLWSGTD